MSADVTTDASELPPLHERSPQGTEILRVEGLTKHFPLRGGLLNRTFAHVQAVDDISFDVKAGETVGLVGEEGRVMRLNAIPLIYYLLTVGILTVLFVYVLFPTVY